MSDALTYTVDAAVAACGLPRSTIYLLLGRGALTARKCGRRTLIDGDSLRQYLDSLPPAVIRSASGRGAGPGSMRPRTAAEPRDAA